MIRHGENQCKSQGRNRRCDCTKSLEMTAILSLRPHVSREDAVRHFTSTLKAANWFHGHIRSIAELYIPFRLFEVRMTNRGREQRHIFGLDAVRGELDLYEFRAPPASSDLIRLESRNVVPATLNSEDSRMQLLQKIRRLVFARGFFRLREVQFDAIEVPGQICIPYWIGFRGADGQVRIAVLDAVRRRDEGAKVRHLVDSWLRGSGST